MLNATVPFLLSSILAVAARGGTTDTAADFPAVVAFELGRMEFLPGDSINLQQLRGTSPTIRTGETYYVEGTYTLASRDIAELAWYATTSSDVSTPTDPRQMPIVFYSPTWVTRSHHLPTLTPPTPKKV